MAGTLSLFQCREEPFQETFFDPKPEAGELVPPEGKGMLVETNQAKAASHMVTALHWAEGEKMKAGTHGVEQRRKIW